VLPLLALLILCFVLFSDQEVSSIA
jgi:hypothetical protein